MSISTGVPPAAAEAEAASPEVAVPILMYHKILPDDIRSRYAVTPEQLEEDFLFLLKNGYRAVFVSDLVKFVKGEGKLPEKPVVITFDDGHYNNLHYALPIAKKTNTKMVFNIIGAFSDHSTNSGDHSNIYYSHLTWQQIKQLSDTGLVEIGSHSWNMHNYKPRLGARPVKGESAEDYIRALRADFSALQKALTDKCNVIPKVFAYPFGEYTPECDKVLLEMGFEAMLTSNAGINVLRVGDTQKLYKLKRFNRESYYTSEQVVQLAGGEITVEGQAG